MDKYHEKRVARTGRGPKGETLKEQHSKIPNRKTLDHDGIRGSCFKNHFYPRQTGCRNE